MNARIVLEFPQEPEAKEIELLVVLAEKFNGVMVESPDADEAGQKQDEFSNRQTASIVDARMPSLHLGLENFPQNLDAFAVKSEDINAIARIFEDEIYAEELCEMLTA